MNIRKNITALMLAITLLLSLSSISKAHEPWYQEKESKTRTGIKIGAGTAVGTGLGALIGGKRGAAAGALLGGGVMVGDSIAKRDSGHSSNTRAIGTVVTGTAVGAGLGAAIGGGKGAGIGALIGVGSSAIYSLTRKDHQEKECRRGR
ncbi:MAG: hypothetical protein AB1489_38790 [Acidobacteriota bacterium]